MLKSPPFILVDGSSYLFRAYHALPALTNSQGMATGAIVGVINMLHKLLKEYKPTYIGVIFDAKGDTFRHRLYPEYKATRPPMPDDLAEQIVPLHQIIQAMGLPLIMVDDVEADDVIGTLAKQAKEKGWKTLISTGDKDLAQLVDESTTLINTMQDELLNIDTVKEKFKVRPDQIIDYLALMGDSADNIPGVPKCGKVTAIKWLTLYDNVEQLIIKADEIKGKIGESLRANLDLLQLSKQLTTIKLDVPLEVKLTDLQIKAADSEKLQHYYLEIESKRLLATLDKDKKTTTPLIKTNYICLNNKTEFKVWIEKIINAPYFAFDTETTSLDYMQAEIVGVSFAIKEGEAVYCPFGHDDLLEITTQLDKEWVLAQLKPILENPNIAKVGQNLKYDQQVLKNHQIELKGIADDTMLASYVFNPTATHHNMTDLAQKYLKLKTTSFEEIAGKGKKQLTFNQISIEKATFYAAEDADITLRLHHFFHPLLVKESNLYTIYKTMEIPLISVLSQMERTGIILDSAMLKQQSQDLAVQINSLTEQAYQIAGRSFNLASPKQIGKIFFEELNYPIISKTAKGLPSTGEAVLQALAEQDYSLAKIILEHRGLAKLKSTYTDKLPEMIQSKTGRLHTAYHQAVTATGRLSSSDPNLQNIPIKTPEGRQIRQAFIPQENWLMLAADYSQIELRIMAHLSKDNGLLDAFKANKDIHSATAAEIYQLDNINKVSKIQRRAAKAVNFGLIYGISAFGLAKQIGSTKTEAKEIMERYFERYPKIKTYMEEIRNLAREKGYIETILGRRLYLPEINSRNYQRRGAAERAAINAPMQGSAADIIKQSMLNIHAWLTAEQPKIQMLLQVHDELVFEVHPDAIELAQKRIKQEMESAIQLTVPLIVEIGIGKNWEQAH